MKTIKRKLEAYKTELAKAEKRNKQLRSMRSCYGRIGRGRTFQETEKTKLDVALIAIAA